MENNTVLEYVEVIVAGVVYRFKSTEEAREFIRSQR